MEEEVQLLRQQWAVEMYHTDSDGKDRLIYELFMLLEKMVTMLRDHDNDLRNVITVPGGEEGDDEK